MSKTAYRITAMTVATLVVLGFCLIAESFLVRSGSVTGSILREIAAAIRDPGMQWIVMLGVFVYFAIFNLIRIRRRGRGFFKLDNFNIWLVSAVWIAVMVYFLNYRAGAQSTAALVLLTGVTLGQGAGAWSEWRGCKNIEVTRIVIYSLLALLFGASLWWGNYTGENPLYRGQARWAGPWDNPNTYGLLMGTGLVLAVAQLIQSSDFNAQSPGSDQQQWKYLWLARAILAVAIISLGMGLLKSYSRGGWLATLCGMSYLIWSWLKQARQELIPEFSHSGFSGSSCLPWFHRNWLAASVLLLSILLLSFWELRDAEWAPARRAFSVGNRNDFSWRNRTAAWEGVLAMMAERPALGFGWNKPEPFYEHYYASPRLEETMAIEMNDYLMLGATLGVPVIFCFGVYFWLSLTRKPEITEVRWLKTVCHAGAIVLLVGFWFDGGLFKLPTAATFWILLELG